MDGTHQDKRHVLLVKFVEKVCLRRVVYFDIVEGSSTSLLFACAQRSVDRDAQFYAAATLVRISISGQELREKPISSLLPQLAIPTNTVTAASHLPWRTLPVKNMTQLLRQYQYLRHTVVEDFTCLPVPITTFDSATATHISGLKTCV